MLRALHNMQFVYTDVYAPHTTVFLSMQAVNKRSANFTVSALWPASMNPCGTVMVHSPLAAGGFPHKKFPLFLEKRSQKAW